MINAGLMNSREPFLFGMLEAKRVYALKDLRNRARISVPDTFLLMGVLDEIGILGPNEVYVHTSTIISEHHIFDSEEKETRRLAKVWTGQCAVTRNPCLHPGDISVLVAVDVPDLAHLRNCIVFSQKGDIPPPSTMSGGMSMLYLIRKSTCYDIN
jgi:RNA-dependent RNA polymerase